jgi:predicted transposase YdaD
MAEGGNRGVWKEKNARNLDFFLSEAAGFEGAPSPEMRKRRVVTAKTQKVRNRRRRKGRMAGGGREKSILPRERREMEMNLHIQQVEDEQRLWRETLDSR